MTAVLTEQEEIHAVPKGQVVGDGRLGGGGEPHAVDTMSAGFPPWAPPPYDTHTTCSRLIGQEESRVAA